MTTTRTAHALGVLALATAVVSAGSTASATGAARVERLPVPHHATVTFHGRGYGHDYMRGGEVLGGYGYAEREEYSRARGELNGAESVDSRSSESLDGSSRMDIRT